MVHHADLCISRIRPAYALSASCMQWRLHFSGRVHPQAALEEAEDHAQQHKQGARQLRTCMSTAGASNSATRPAANTMMRS